MHHASSAHELKWIQVCLNRFDSEQMDPNYSHGPPWATGISRYCQPHTHTQVYAAWHNQHFLIRRNVVFVSVCVRLKSSRRCLVGLEMVVLRSHIALPISICIF